MKLVKDYLFKVTFADAKTTLFVDESPPLGELSGPNASRLLTAAVANCLCASLAFCLRKSRIELSGLQAEAEPTIERNKEGYWRITKVDVRITPTIPGSVDDSKVKRCLEIFEKYCIATGGVREGIRVDVHVNPS